MEDHASGGVATCVLTYLASNLLQSRHYKVICKALANRWSRFSSLNAAIMLLETYGVQLSREEQDRLAGLDKSRQIEALTMKMPQTRSGQFQQFFLQLQLIVSTASRVRKALEECRPDVVSRLLEDAEMSGISQYIIRMAIVQAGSEVQVMDAEYRRWCTEMDTEIAPLLRKPEDAALAKKRLAIATAQLNLQQHGVAAKAKGVIMNFLAQSTSGLISASFQGWKRLMSQMAIERDVLADLVRVEAKLLEYKLSSFQGVRTAIEKQAKELGSSLLRDIVLPLEARCCGRETDAG